MNDFSRVFSFFFFFPYVFFMRFIPDSREVFYYLHFLKDGIVRCDSLVYRCGKIRSFSQQKSFRLTFLSPSPVVLKTTCSVIGLVSDFCIALYGCYFSKCHASYSLYGLHTVPWGNRIGFLFREEASSSSGNM